MENNEKTFTQEDVNKIVQERLAKEKGKNTESYEQREKDLSAREMKLKVRETLSEKNLPAELIDVINFTDEDSLKSSIEIMGKYINGKSQKLSGNPPANPDVAFGGTADSVRQAMGLPI